MIEIRRLKMEAPSKYVALVERGQKVFVLTSHSGETQSRTVELGGRKLQVGERVTQVYAMPFDGPGGVERLVALPEVLPNTMDWDFRYLASGAPECIFSQDGGARLEIVVRSHDGMVYPASVQGFKSFFRPRYVRPPETGTETTFSAVSRMGESVLYTFSGSAEQYAGRPVMQGVMDAAMLRHGQEWLVFYKRPSYKDLNAVGDHAGPLSLAMLGPQFDRREDLPPPLGEVDAFNLAVDQIGAQVALLALLKGRAVLALGEPRKGKFRVVGEVPEESGRTFGRVALLARGSRLYLAIIELDPSGAAYTLMASLNIPAP